MNLITSPFSDPAKFWKAVNLNNKTSISLPSAINYGDSVISEQKEICTAINKHFIDIGHLFESSHVGPPGYLGHNNSVEGMPHSFSLQPLSPFVVYDALNSADARKSTGEDKLDPFFLKLCALLITEPLTYTFNLPLSIGIVPRVWNLSLNLETFLSC